MKVEFAPLNIPLRRRLQTAAVLQWVFSFLALAQCCLAAFVLLALSDWWVVALLYAGWLWLDWDTPTSGGRRSRWVRSWTVWEYFRDYFPITLVKTVDLDPKKNYIFGFHPHGVLVAGGFGNFCTEATGFSRLFPGLTSHLLMLPFWFRVPLFRDYIMCGGLVSSCKSSLSYLVSRPEGGNVAVIAVGGAPEALDARPGALTLQNRLQSIMGVALPLFHARGVFQYSFGLIPYRKSIHTVVGRPISVAQTPSPSSKDIESLHKVYLQSLTELFEQHKHTYGYSEDQHLTFI
ncbi:2-acylglycerol O-acyltransferase 2-A-like isoform X2 [Seriola lalandi dorsalis]|uniref:2-acylglycerol O-acyltransferase 2-A-like isoform X2 n=1 Tax=Seriola lalandi dorsalis TaxID=1841481 RepID=UPI000C6FB798|nr:2-acylglycerol O-acyltransferase 2-A-like isoform X2 [Seriola lalandi dorsalis]XP_056224947.1 2-acylglycerol O-acyltransferase 2-A isoform X2 [Seriola aureovittata]